MTPATQFATWRTRAGLSVIAAARMCGVARSTVYRWETGESPIPWAAAERMRKLALPHTPGRKRVEG